tara:strand:+ start:499 stop:1704 length:1206 start_codon:yes stop_codon:yes gene_type:complete
MAQIGFGLNTFNSGKEVGYDYYETSFGDAMGAVASETWARNPLSSLSSLYELRTAEEKKESPLVPRNDLNKEYSNLGLFFEEDEYQSVVDIMVEEKNLERARQDIINRGPQGVGTGVAKFGVGLGVSMLDPINLASAFIPVFGQARFASLVARQGFTKARVVRGAVEGAVGAALVEPLIGYAASELQADYGLADSFLNVTFGSILGGGLHFGGGKLKDIYTARKFKKKVRIAREKAGIENARDVEINLYKVYYPEKSAIMRDLAETDPQTRELLLKKSVNDLLLEEPVDVAPIVNSDPTLKQSSDMPGPSNTKVKTENQTPQKDLNTVKKNTVNKEAADMDTEIDSLTARLEEQREKTADLRFDENRKEITTATDELDQANANPKEVNEAIVDAINCMNGR